MNHVAIIPARGAPLSLDALENSEREIAIRIAEIDDVPTLEDMRDRFAAIEQYARKKQLHLPALGAQRRLEARIGQLLGPATLDHDRSKGATSAAQDVAKNDRHDFRVLARALSGEIEIDADEWRQSRTALVKLIKDRIAEEEKMQAAETAQKPTTLHAGNRVNIPEGKTPEEITREGLALEKDGVSADAVAGKIGVAINSYRRMREIVLLADRDGYTDRDRDVVDTALAILNRERLIGEPAAMVEPIAVRVWGDERRGRTRGPALEEARLEKFEDVFSLIIFNCRQAPEIELPYLSSERAHTAERELSEAIHHLRALQRRIREIHE